MNIKLEALERMKKKVDVLNEELGDCQAKRNKNKEEWDAIFEKWHAQQKILSKRVKEYYNLD